MNRIFHPADGVDAPAQSTEIDRALLRLLSVPFFAMLTAIGAQIAIPIEPFGIPITLQTLMVLLAAMALGPKLGMASMVLYLVMGIVGVGVFAEGESGWLVLLGQTGGYLFGFVVCQPIAHKLVKRRDGTIRGWLGLFLAGLAVHMVIFVFGVPWLWWTHWADDGSVAITWGEAIEGGFTVFIPGILLKSGIAAGIGAWALPSIARRLW